MWRPQSGKRLHLSTVEPVLCSLCHEWTLFLNDRFISMYTWVEYDFRTCYERPSVWRDRFCWAEEVVSQDRLSCIHLVSSYIRMTAVPSSKSVQRVRDHSSVRVYNSVSINPLTLWDRCEFIVLWWMIVLNLILRFVNFSRMLFFRVFLVVPF